MLQLMAEGRSNEGIAERLALGEPAVEAHVTTILRKLQLPAGDGGRAGRAGRPHLPPPVALT